MKVDEYINKPYRGLDKLSPDFRKKVDKFIEEVGDSVFITETWRSQKRQDWLYAQGRTRSGQVVTWTKNSNHTKGIAIDIAFRGDDLYPSEHYRWANIAEIANKYGIDWGYDLWGMDKPHFQDGEGVSEEVLEVEERNGKFLQKYGITNKKMDKPISKRDVITILSKIDHDNATK